MNRLVVGMLVLGLGAGFLCGWMATSFFGDVPPPHVPASPPDSSVTQPDPSAKQPDPSAKQPDPSAPEPAAPAPGVVEPPVAPAETPRRLDTTPRNPVVNVPSIEEQVEALTQENEARADADLQRAEATARAQALALLRREHAFFEEHKPKDVFDLLGHLKRDRDIVPMSFASDVRRLAAYFPNAAAGERRPLPGRRTKRDAPEDGQVFLIPDGVSRFDGRKLNRIQHMTIEGAGMDRSLLVLNPGIGLKKGGTLTVRDVTVYCERRAVFRLGRPFALRLERCRVIGHETPVFGGSIGAVWATDCKFDMRFTLSKRVDLFDRGGAVARFERCLFAGPWRRVGVKWGAVVFDRCAFEDMAQLPGIPPRAVHVNFANPDTRFTTSAPRRRTVSEINDAWELR